MAERKKERKRQKVEDPVEPRSRETKQGNQTKFVIGVDNLKATPDEIDNIKSALLKQAVTQLKDFRSTKGGVLERPNIGVEFFSLSFSLSFSLGA